MANHQCIAVVRIERIVVNSADPPCCEISLCYQWDVPIYYPWDRFVRLFINLSAAIGLPRGPISAQSRLLPWMTHFQPTPHWCLITGLERVLLEMIQLPPKLRACHLQGERGRVTTLRACHLWAINQTIAFDYVTFWVQLRDILHTLHPLFCLSRADVNLVGATYVECVELSS